MDQKQFREIIEFAIEREEEAVAFYQDLQKKTKFAAQEEMLKELEEMERGHARMLNQILQQGTINLREKEVQDLHISDYIVEVEPSANMSYQDILIIAMKREEASKTLYANMAVAISDENLQKVFKRLAAEEAGHKLKFERLYDDEILTDN